MDVEMQMEANGLPAHFSSTSEQPAENHVADNLAASISNSDAPISLPSKPAVTESAPESDQVFNASFHTQVPGILPEALPPSTNGINASAEQSISTVPDSQPQPSLETNSIPPSTSLTDSMTDSVVPSSIPAEIQSSATPAETQPTMMDIAEPVSVPPQPPESDLRTAPHSDALSPEAVAQVEAQKHQLDNSADIVPSPADANVMDISVAPDSANAIEQTPVTNLGLPSPPARSPSPAPQPAPASLPEHKLTPSISASEPASEPASAPTLAPELEPQQILAPQSESEAVLAAESDIEPIPAPQPETESIPSTEPRPQTPPTAAPAEEPKEPAPTPAVPTTQLGEDQEMIDVSHAKQPRPREDDDADSERAAKRVKTDESAAASQSAGFKVPEVPMAASSPVANGGTPTATAPSDGDDTVTPARVAHFKKVISNLKKSNSSTPFRVPVDHVALNIPSYPDI
ncbi:transcription initiation at TATA-containing promoter protein, partial [Exophiala xenobiotica]